MTEITTDFCKIEVLEHVKLQEFTNCFVFEITVQAKKAFEFFVNDIRCVQGENITKECNFQNLDILEDTKLKRYEKIKGHVVFRKNYIGTLNPVLEFQRTIKKVKTNVITK